MDGKSKRARTGILAGVFGTLAVLAVVGMLVVYTGAYNVAATEEHRPITRWALETNFHNSVEARAADSVAPATITPAMIVAGASAYNSMGQHCHAGPGAEREDWASGMRPRPPHKTEAAARWEINQISWIVKHGVKMTGMPAFGPSHDEKTLWGTAAFVSQLPAMTPERYAEMGGSVSAPTGHRHRQ